MESLGFTAVEFTNETLKSILLHKPQFIYCSAENATSQSFLDALRAELHNSVAAIVVDECGNMDRKKVAYLTLLLYCTGTKNNEEINIICNPNLHTI